MIAALRVSFFACLLFAGSVSANDWIAPIKELLEPTLKAGALGFAFFAAIFSYQLINAGRKQGVQYMIITLACALVFLISEFIPKPGPRQVRIVVSPEVLNRDLPMPKVVVNTTEMTGISHIESCENNAEVQINGTLLNKKLEEQIDQLESRASIEAAGLALTKQDNNLSVEASLDINAGAPQ